MLQERQAQQHHALPHAGLLHLPLTFSLQVLCMHKSFQCWTFLALQGRQVQEQLSALAKDVATKMAGQAADIRRLNALVEQVGHAAVVMMACVRDELGRNGARPTQERKCSPV